MQREARLLAARELRALLQERDTLLEEVNTWRSQQGLNPAESTGETEGVKEVMKVENEVFGEFDAGCIGGDMDEEDYGEMEASFIGSEGAIERSSISSHATSLSQGAQAQSFIDLAAHSRSASAASQYGPDFFTSFAGLNDQSLDTFTSSISDFSPAVTSQSPLSSASFNEHAPVPFGGVMPSDEKVASWAAETLYQHLQKQQNHAQVQHAVQQRSRGDGGLDGFEDLYAGLNPNTAALLANMAVQQPRTFAGQYIADQEEVGLVVSSPFTPVITPMTDSVLMSSLLVCVYPYVFFLFSSIFSLSNLTNRTTSPPVQLIFSKPPASRPRTLCPFLRPRLRFLPRLLPLVRWMSTLGDDLPSTSTLLTSNLTMRMLPTRSDELRALLNTPCSAAPRRLVT